MPTATSCLSPAAPSDCASPSTPVFHVGRRLFAGTATLSVGVAIASFAKVLRWSPVCPPDMFRIGWCSFRKNRSLQRERTWSGGAYRRRSRCRTTVARGQQNHSWNRNMREGDGIVDNVLRHTALDLSSLQRSLELEPPLWPLSQNGREWDALMHTFASSCSSSSLAIICL